jgi:hypothetical protein
VQGPVGQFINPETGFICTKPYGTELAIQDEDQQEIWLQWPDPYPVHLPLPINTLLGGNDDSILKHTEDIVGDFHIALQDLVWRHRDSRVEHASNLLLFPLGSVLYSDPSNGVSQIGCFRNVSFKFTSEIDRYREDVIIKEGWLR